MDKLADDEKAKRIELQEKLWVVMVSNESLLRQKSRDKWLLEGDNCTNYFHRAINWRRKKYSLKGLRVKEPVGVKEKVKRFFCEKYSEDM